MFWHHKKGENNSGSYRSSRRTMTTTITTFTTTTINTRSQWTYKELQMIFPQRNRFIFKLQSSDTSCTYLSLTPFPQLQFNRKKNAQHHDRSYLEMHNTRKGYKRNPARAILLHVLWYHLMVEGSRKPTATLRENQTKTSWTAGEGHFKFLFFHKTVISTLTFSADPMLSSNCCELCLKPIKKHTMKCHKNKYHHSQSMFVYLVNGITIAAISSLGILMVSKQN